jgi:hypothetical protein
MRAIAKIVALILLLFAVPAFAQSDPGWILPKPYSINDAVNTNAMKWTGVWLINYSPLNPVIVAGVTSSQPWLSIPWSGGVINTQDSVFVPIVLNGAELTGGQTIYGHLTINHDGVNSPKVVDVSVYINSGLPMGPQIAVLPQMLNLSLEQNVNGELKIQVSNTGDLPLQVIHCYNTSPLLVPLIDTAFNVTPIAPAELIFQVNTNGFFDDQIVIDTIFIQSTAINAPVYKIPVMVHILPYFDPGTSRYGDVNWDGYCNIMDLYYIVGYFKGVNPTAPCWPACDINGNGTFTGSDVTELVRYLKGIGPSPVNACPEPVANNTLHLPNRQIEIGYLKGHRGEWVSSSVNIQTQNYFAMQGVMSLPIGLIDDATAINISTDPQLHPGIVAFDNLRPGYKSLILQEEDSNSPRLPIPLFGPTPIYSLQLHIPFGAPVGSFPIIPDNVSDRGSSKFSPNYGDTMEAPLFMGSYLTIAPRVSINHFTGIGDIIFAHDSTTLIPSITINSDGNAVGSVYIAIMASNTGTIVYADTLPYLPLHAGQNAIVFNHPWAIHTVEPYIAAAGVIVDGDDYPLDNYAGKPINITSYITTGLPPREGFEEPLTAAFPPVGWMVINRGGPNTWERTGLKSRGGSTRSAAVLTQSGEDQNEWFVKGPMDWSAVNDPAIIFYEAQDDWYLYGYQHEFYVSVGDTFNADEATLIATHTPDDHDILPYFNDDSIEISLTEYGNTDRVWFAFRYLKNPTGYGSDSWFVEDVSWVDRSIPIGYEYIIGDANFAALFNQQNGHPVLSGSDVTYAVRFLKGLSPGCFYTKQITPESSFTLFAMLDVNGDCKVLGSDITRMVRYFKSLIPIDSLKPCSVFTPVLTPIEANYPPCNVTMPAARIIPSKQAGGSENSNDRAIIRRERH